MRAVVQRVRNASVCVSGDLVAEIGAGLLVFVGVGKNDDESSAAWMARKLSGLRIFADAEGRFDNSVADIEGDVLIVSQFTLYADTRKGRRPSFADASSGDDAARLYQRVISELRALEIPAHGGRFGADMQVALVNDGPVTILLESPAG